ncbi:MAG: hypothetical protein HOV87_06835 [Catenulispora sp.]|nr:hypothetical protein [Catenulispora sp.]
MSTISSGHDSGTRELAGEPYPAATTRIPGTIVAITAIVLTGVVTMTVAGVPAAGIATALAITVEAVRRLYKAVTS